MRALLVVAFLALSPLVAGCLDGPTRVASIPESCPSWVPGLGGPQVTTVMNPRDPTTWSSVDFDGGNATRPPAPLTTGDTQRLADGTVITQDLIEMDFGWERKPDGTYLRRGVFVQGGELLLQFTHGSGAPGEGRELPFYVVGLPEGVASDGKLVAFNEFSFRDRFAANFTVRVFLDQPDGTADPAGAYALWTYTPSVAQPTPPAYIYHAVGLYDRCETT